MSRQIAFGPESKIAGKTTKEQGRYFKLKSKAAESSFERETVIMCCEHITSPLYIVSCG